VTCLGPEVRSFSDKTTNKGNCDMYIPHPGVTKILHFVKAIITSEYIDRGHNGGSI
jgi:hypothetical protein